jgi:hypothetical protein
VSLGAIFSGFNEPGPLTVLRARTSAHTYSMTDKSAKAKKPKKSATAQEGVLASLPSTRPERLGRRSGASTSRATSAKAAPKRATAAAAKPAAAKPAKPKPKATRSTAASRAATAEKAQRRTSRPASPPPPPPEPPRKPAGPPKGPELVTTAIQAVGEVAHIGITVGGQVLKRAAKRLPRP